MLLGHVPLNEEENKRRNVEKKLVCGIQLPVSHVSAEILIESMVAAEHESRNDANNRGYQCKNGTDKQKLEVALF